MEYLGCFYRDAGGAFRECPYPEREPDPYGVPADLYCVSYEVRGSLFSKRRIVSIDISIFNTRGYRRDPDLEEYVRTRAVEAIVAKQGAEVVAASGGPSGLRSLVGFDTFWREPPH